MKFLRWMCLVLVTSLPAMAFAGDIQVSCAPALRVYLDGDLIGTSNAKDDGLFLANVARGSHVVRIEKDGFVAQIFRVEVRDLPIEVKVGEFSPEPLIRHEQETSSPKVKPPAGNLHVTSAPQNCVVEIDGKSETKSTPLLLIEGIAAGEHRISFSKPGYNRISGMVTIQPGADVTVRGDLTAGKFEAINEGKGSLRVISTPEYCAVRFLGTTRQKTRTRLNLSHIPVGEHLIVVTWKGRELSSNVVITKGRRTVVVVSFMKGDEPFVVSYEPE